MQRGATPYKQLGKILTSIRERTKESLAEVSGAVELETEMVTRFENGEERPSEDILSLLISHFDVQDEEADTLWDLAGYDKNANDDQPEPLPNTQTIMMLPFDARIVYTDTAHVLINNYGVIMNFMQGGGPNNQPMAVARVGMSLEHARSVLDVLQKTIAQADAEAKKDSKSLPAPNQSGNTKKKS
jgi:transcriptional regulator with XRE-family HTH domain